MGRLLKSRWFDGCWLACCLLASSAWCLSTGRELSATFDEPLYIERGLERWRSGSHAGLMKLGTMPLPIDWDTLPLYVYERWTGRPIDSVRDLAWALPWARTSALVFWWLLLVYGGLAGRSLAGPLGGRLAAAWLACEPNLLAHASLATTDIAIGACLLGLVYHFGRNRDTAWWRRVGVPGVWFAATLLAKASGMVFGPLCLVAVEFYRTRLEQRRAAAEVDARRFGGRDIVQIVAVGFVLAFFYCGCDWRPEPSFVKWAHKLPEGRTHEAMVWLSEHLCIFSNAGEGLVRQVKHNIRGHHGAYLLGHAYSQSVWYYFPLALAIKLTLPLLVAPLAVMLAGRRAAFNWAIAAALVLLLFSLNCRVQIGIRLVLPLVTMLVVGVAAAMVVVLRDSSRRARPFWVMGAFAAVLWTSAAAWRVWPEGLCYTNELWGGTPNGYLCLSDSNYDWGQGVKELAAWSARRGLGQLDVWYFGGDPGVNAAPLRHLPLHALPIAKPDQVRDFVQGRYLAVGTTLLYGISLNLPGHGSAVEFLRSKQPVARTSTFLIYDLGAPPSSVAQIAGPAAPQ